MTSARPPVGARSAVAAVVPLGILLGVFFVIVGAALLFPAEPEEARPPPTADELAGLCTAEPEPARDECYLSALEPLLSSNGIASTFGLLLEVTRIDPYASREAHALAHELGRRAYTIASDPGGAIAECPHTLASGCSHGVMEAHLTATGIQDESEIAGICDGFENGFSWFQCLHGLGHGLTMFLEHNLTDALRYCDALSSQWSQESCYGGVFMENIVSYTLFVEKDGSADPHAHHEMRTHGVLLPADPHYPCSVAEERYLRSCYLLQSSAFLELNGGDFGEAFRQCSLASEPYDEVCYQSLGRDVSAFAGRDPSFTRSLCALGNQTANEWCLFGAVKDFINTLAEPAPGLELCAVVERGFKETCYRAVGEMVMVLIQEPLIRSEVCKQAEPDFVATCSIYAGVTPAATTS